VIVADLAPGTVLADRFEVHGVLGRGGMATVYLAHDREDGRNVALKLLHPHLLTDPGARRRLSREIEGAGRLDHPGLLVATQFIESDGQVGLVLPLHEGRTLAEQVALEGPLPPEQVRRLGLRLAEALGHAHRAGVLHRDLSPRNVLLDARGAPVLTDFGMARLADRGTGRSTALIGTAGFVAPELLTGQRADPRSDLYGLGAVLYLAATGREPFAADHPSASLTRQLAGEVAPIASVVPEFPPWLDSLITSLLDPKPEGRSGGAAALVAALEDRRAPTVEVAAVSAPAVTAALPAGRWSVVVEDRQQGRGLRRAQRKLRRMSERGQGGRNDVARLLDSAAGVLDRVAGPSDEERLAAGVARHAGLPAEALPPPAALETGRYRIVAHVDQPTAEAVANDVRGLGLKATVVDERRVAGIPDWFLANWWVAIPVMWILFPALMIQGAPEWTVLLLTAVTVMLATLAAPLASRRALVRKLPELPVAWTADLRPMLAEGWRARALLPSSPAPATPLTRAQELGGQALASLDRLAAAVDNQTADLAQVVRDDLRVAMRELRSELEVLRAEVEGSEKALQAIAPRPDGAWAAERLARLDTLARGGDAVDPVERNRLASAIAAHESALQAEGELESRTNADLARLLEIAATASRLRQELELGREATRRPEVALDDLRVRAAAAAAARSEVGR
jgi:Protein kinase domain